MSRQASPGAAAAARSLGLKTPAYLHLRESLAAGEFPVYLRTADPALAGMFPNPFGFELLLERLRQVDNVERRRANLLRTLEGREEVDALRAMVEEARDEGDLEDAALGAEPSPAPDGVETPDKEEHAAFVAALRGDAKLARALREAFAEQGVLEVEAVGDSKDAERFRNLAGEPSLLKDVDASRYLQLRRGERAHALKLTFDLTRATLYAVFDAAVSGYPVQEKESYLALFQDFVRAERLPRLVQGARARLKRAAEEQALEQGWSMVEQALDRGRQEGPVLGLCAGRGRKLIAALGRDVHEVPRTAVLDPGAEDFADKLAAFLGEDKPTLVAFQADGPTRSATQKLMKALRGSDKRLRQVPVPVAVTRTMLREVARRPSEALLGHEERQAFLVAVLALEPRAAAFHTPHVVRAFIPFRGEINHRILDDFEATFLRALLQGRGVDVNTAGADLLKLVPGVDAAAVVVERSTAPFRSLEDFQARMCLSPEVWRAACCLLRVRGGDDPLDARPLHPMFYGVLRAAAEKAEVEVEAVVGDPGRLASLPWGDVLEGEEYAEGVVACIRRGLARTTRRRPRPGRPAARPVEALQPGSTLKGKITNLTDYGAFVDIGARREGLVHVSQCAATFVKHPSEVLEAGQEVEVRVLSVDLESQKIRLSMLSEEQEKERAAARGGPREGGGGGRGGRGDGPGGGRPGGGRSGGGRPGGRPGGRRDGGRRDGGGGRRGPRENYGPDPRAVKEEFDPTNPFYQFFKDQGGKADDEDGK